MLNNKKHELNNVEGNQVFKMLNLDIQGSVYYIVQE